MELSSLYIDPEVGYKYDLALQPNFLCELEYHVRVNNNGNHEFTIPTQNLEYLKFIEEIKNNPDLKKEIWRFKRSTRWNEIGSPYLAFVDKKNVARFKLTLMAPRYDKPDKAYISLFEKTFDTKWRIGYDDLRAKGRLNKANFILPHKYASSQFAKVFYEDDVDAFELTANSFFDDMNAISIHGKIDDDYNILLFKFGYNISTINICIDKSIVAIADLSTLNSVKVFTHEYISSNR